MEFRDIYTSDRLVDYLLEKGMGHKNYHHYTNISSAIKMIDSCYWHLSAGDRMNDKQELTKGNSERWKNIFISSFAYGDNENIAMWGLYGLPWEDAVRITIPKHVMRNWILNSNEIYKVLELGNGNYAYELLYQTDTSVHLTDVAYVNGTRGGGDGSIKWNNKTIYLNQRTGLIGISDNPIITGYIKNDAWSFENETRIRVEFTNTQGLKKIAIKIPEYVINNLEIKAGPWMKYDLRTRISQEISKYLNIRHTQSSFQNLVDLRSICHYCQHGEFVKAYNQA